MKRLYLFLMRSYVAGVLYQRGEKAELDSDKMKGLIKMGAVQELPEPVTPVTPVASVTPGATTTLPIAPAAPVATVTPAVPVATVTASEPTEPVKPVEPVATVEPTVATANQATDSQTTGTQDTPSNDTNVYGNLTKAQLNAELDKRGIAHDAKATNAELEALLVADDEQKSAATATAPVTPDV